MPKISRLEDKERQFMERLRRGDQHRGGEHMTSAIWCNIKATVKPALAAAGIDVRLSDVKILQFKTGKLWEPVLLKGAWRQQYKIGSPDDDSVGTVDGMLPHTWYPIEAKTTKSSSLAGPSDATMMQLGGYAARCMLKHGPHAEAWHGEVRTLHLNGDCGKNKCPEHSYPEEKVRRENNETGRKRLCCPKCLGWLFGEQVHERRDLAVSWPREELLSLHRMLTQRLGELRQDRATYLVRVRAGPANRAENFKHTPLPEWQWGYPEIECEHCEVKELVGCPGQNGADEMEEKLEGSILDLEQKELTA